MSDENHTQSIEASKLLQKVCGETITLPEGFPAVTLLTLDAHVDLEKKEFSFSATGDFSWSPLGEAYVINATASFLISRNNGVNQILIHVNSKEDETINFAGVVKMHSLGFRYTHSNGDWQMHGKLMTQIEGRDFATKAELKRAEKTKKIKITSLVDSDKEEVLKIQNFQLNKIKVDMTLDISKSLIEGGFNANTTIAGVKGEIVSQFDTGQRLWNTTISLTEDQEILLSQLLTEIDKGLTIPVYGLDFRLTKVKIKVSNQSLDIDSLLTTNYTLPGFNTKVKLDMQGAITYLLSLKQLQGNISGIAHFDDMTLGAMLDLTKKELSMNLPQKAK